MKDRRGGICAGVARVSWMLMQPRHVSILGLASAAAILCSSLSATSHSSTEYPSRSTTSRVYPHLHELGFLSKPETSALPKQIVSSSLFRLQQASKKRSTIAKDAFVRILIRGNGRCVVLRGHVGGLPSGHTRRTWGC